MSNPRIHNYQAVTKGMEEGTFFHQSKNYSEKSQKIMHNIWTKLKRIQNKTTQLTAMCRTLFFVQIVQSFRNFWH